jgi:hypothetical protein
MKDKFYKKLEPVFDTFPKYNQKILLGDFINKVGKEDIFKLTIEIQSLHEICNDNGVTQVDFTTSRNHTEKSTMFPHCSIHKYICMSQNLKTHIQVDNFLVGRQRHLSVLDIQSFRVADCDIGYYLVVSQFWGDTTSE